MKRGHLIFVFTALILSLALVPVSTQQGIKDYDPWADLNDDGKIDIKDVAIVASKFGTEGDEVNKTALLYDVNATFTELLERIEILNITIMQLKNTVTYLNNTVTYLNTTVVHLNETVTYLNGTGLGAPDYDSGWMNISQGQEIVLTHNLGTTDVLVYMVGKNPEHDIHQSYYGSDHTVTGNIGAKWRGLTNAEITITRAGGDDDWQQIRVMIWKIPSP